MNDHSETEHLTPEEAQTASHSDAASIDTAKIQEALEKRADQETADLPHLTIPTVHESQSDEPPSLTADHSIKPSENHLRTETEKLHKQSWKTIQKKRRTGRSLSERWWTPSVRSWFFTFMCMNMPIVGWFYLFHEARHEEDPARKEFAQAYLFYKLVFLIAGAIVLLILIWIGLGLLDQLLAYMEML